MRFFFSFPPGRRAALVRACFAPSVFAIFFSLFVGGAAPPPETAPEESATDVLLEQGTSSSPMKKDDFFPSPTSFWTDSSGFKYPLPLKLQSRSEVILYGLVDAAKMMGDPILQQDVDGERGQPLWDPLTILDEETGKRYAVVTVWLNDFEETDCGAGGYLETWYNTFVVPRGGGTTTSSSGDTSGGPATTSTLPVARIGEITGALAGDGQASSFQAAARLLGLVMQPGVQTLLLRVLCGNHPALRHSGNAERAVSVGRDLFGFPKHPVLADIAITYSRPVQEALHDSSSSVTPGGAGGCTTTTSEEEEEVITTTSSPERPPLLYRFTAKHKGETEVSVRAGLPTDLALGDPVEAKPDPAQKLETAIGGVRDGSSPLQAFYATGVKATMLLAPWDPAAGDEFSLGKQGGYYAGPLGRWDFVPVVKQFFPDFKVFAERPARTVWRAAPAAVAAFSADENSEATKAARDHGGSAAASPGSEAKAPDAHVGGAPSFDPPQRKAAAPEAPGKRLVLPVMKINSSNDQRVIFITGSTGGGLGQAVTETLLRDTRNIVYAGVRSFEKLLQTFKHLDQPGDAHRIGVVRAEELLQRHSPESYSPPNGPRLRFIELDLNGSDDSLRNAVRLAEDTSGKQGIDVLINAAGMGRNWPIECESSATKNECLQLNLNAPIVLSQAVLPGMKKAQAEEFESGAGSIIPLAQKHIVNVASIGGVIPDGMVEMYCAAKYGLVGFSESLQKTAVEFGIKVTAVCPGPMDTPALAASAQTTAVEHYEAGGVGAGLDAKTKQMIAQRHLMFQTLGEMKAAVPAERAAQQLVDEVLEATNPHIVHVMSFGFLEGELEKKFAPGFLARRNFEEA